MVTNVRILIIILLKIIYLIISLYFYLFKVSDFDSFTLISNYYNISIHVENDSSIYYFLPKEKKNLFYFKYASGNHFFEIITAKNNEVTFKNIAYSSLILVKRNIIGEKFTINYDIHRKSYQLSPFNSSINLEEFVFGIILKSVTLFIFILIPLICIDKLLLKQTRYLKFSIIISVAFTFISVYGSIYGLFILKGIQLIFKI